MLLFRSGWRPAMLADGRCTVPEYNADIETRISQFRLPRRRCCGRIPSRWSRNRHMWMDR